MAAIAAAKLPAQIVIHSYYFGNFGGVYEEGKGEKTDNDNGTDNEK